MNCTLKKSVKKLLMYNLHTLQMIQVFYRQQLNKPRVACFRKRLRESEYFK